MEKIQKVCYLNYVYKSKVKGQGHTSLLHLVQVITQESLAPEASNLVGWYVGRYVGRSVSLNLVQLITQECFAQKL